VGAAGVEEVLFGVGFGGGEALKRCVEDADDPLLLGERGDGNRVAFNKLFRDALVSYCARHTRCSLDSKYLTGQIVV